ncbi:MAG: polyhydroxyalkanoic acid system family protein [Planctomycetes bacterium]|nr:polyhydroxyalkanoic acid system family protein [Planctomycetota bacterium]MBU4398242.1 polyhydroxyalkanoic acid system family protein [Planctomycetota bacterium]MCG2683463.1 polyhydroxyalkanoic acid system family protein [Planctomycetales bacterium]
MPRLSLEFPHSIGQEEAARRLKEKFAAARAEHQDRVNDFHDEWKDHTFFFAFKALGMAVGGTVAVEPERIVLEAEIPLAAMLVKRAIKDRLRQEVAGMLAP